MGLDLSLSGTGVAATDTVTGRVAIGTIKPHYVGVQRLGEIRSAITDLITAHRPRVAVIEGYAFGSHTSGSRSIGELGGVVRLLLHDNGIPFAEVPPTTLKKFAVGKGNAGKDAVFSAAVRREPRINTNDAADAWWLFCMGCAHYDAVQVPRAISIGKVRQEQLGRVTWPEIGRKVESL